VTVSGDTQSTPDGATPGHVLEAPAKLTLSLRVVGVRNDGFHLIDAEMITLDLHDSLRISPGPSAISVSGPFAHGVPTSPDNLVVRALQLANRTATVHIEKRIPNGGGLGGGSADAAAVLRWAGYTDLEGASRLGADIPFCMVGGRAYVRGIGEIVEPFTADQRLDEPLDITLVVPPLHVSTPAVYRAWDELHRGAVRGEPASAQDDAGVNDLQSAAISVEPRLATWRDRIREATGKAPTLAGSGATWFLHGRHDIADALHDATVIMTRSR
jgi:4-diphosphocytidyl-2-C-methyl-D-erythritol kinase